MGWLMETLGRWLSHRFGPVADASPEAPHDPEEVHRIADLEARLLLHGWF